MHSFIAKLQNIEHSTSNVDAIRQPADIPPQDKTYTSTSGGPCSVMAVVGGDRCGILVRRSSFGGFFAPHGAPTLYVYISDGEGS